MAPKPKLFYFNIRGRGELLRLVLTAAGVEFEDIRVEFSQWPEMKPKTPNGTLPYMEIDGKQYGESLPLVRHFARKHNLMGKTDLEQLSADIILNHVDDLRTAFIRLTTDKILTAEMKKSLETSLLTEHLPNFLNKIEKILVTKKTKYLVTDSMTVADIAVVEVLDTLEKKNPKLLEKFPKITEHRKMIQKAPKIAQYLSARPDTDM